MTYWSNLPNWGVRVMWLLHWIPTTQYFCPWYKIYYWRDPQSQTPASQVCCKHRDVPCESTQVTSWFVPTGTPYLSVSFQLSCDLILCFHHILLQIPQMSAFPPVWPLNERLERRWPAQYKEIYATRHHFTAQSQPLDACIPTVTTVYGQATA